MPIHDRQTEKTNTNIKTTTDDKTIKNIKDNTKTKRTTITNNRLHRKLDNTKTKRTNNNKQQTK